MDEPLALLEQQREELRAGLAGLGDLRPGSLIQRQRRCGKPNCRCAAEYGPRHHDWIVTHVVNGKTVTRSIPAAAVEKTRAQIAEYRHFRELMRRFVALNERLCDAKLREDRTAAPPTAKKRGLKKPSRGKSRPKSRR